MSKPLSKSNKGFAAFIACFVLVWWIVVGNHQYISTQMWLFFIVISLVAGHALSSVNIPKWLTIALWLNLAVCILFGFMAIESTRKFMNAMFTERRPMGYYQYFLGIATVYAFALNRHFKYATRTAFNYNPEQVENDQNATPFSGTASQRRMHDVTKKGLEESEPIATTFLGGLMSVISNLFSSPKPTAEVQIDQTDYLQNPNIVGDITNKLIDQNGVFVGSLLGKNLNISTEDRALIIGPPGTGKTAFLVSQLLTWSETKRPFICLDMKPEIWGITKETLINKGYKVLVYNPTSGFGDKYNPLDDIHSPESIGELTANLIEEQGSDNAVFFETARDLLDAVINHLKSKNGSITLPDIRQYFISFTSSEKLIKSLLASKDTMTREIASELSMVAENERLFASVIASLRTGLRFLRFPAIKESLSGSDFSLKDFKNESKPVALFLQFEEGKAEMLQRLTAMMIGHIMRYMIDNTDRAEVLLLLDEIGNAKGIKGLPSKLNTIRSRKLPTWLYWQSSTQMNLYSEDNADGKELIFGACDFVGVFRLNDNDTAKYISDKIGTVHRLITNHNTSYTVSRSSGSGSSASSDSGVGGGSASISNSSSVSKGMNDQKTKQLQEEPVIKPHELQELPDGQMVCMYRGDAWKGEATPYYQSNPEFMGVKPDIIRPIKENKISSSDHVAVNPKVKGLTQEHEISKNNAPTLKSEQELEPDMLKTDVAVDSEEVLPDELDINTLFRHQAMNNNDNENKRKDLEYDID